MGNEKKVSSEVSNYLAQLGRNSAKKRMETLSPRKRKEIARAAARARWAKAKVAK